MKLSQNLKGKCRVPQNTQKRHQHQALSDGDLAVVRLRNENCFYPDSTRNQDNATTAYILCSVQLSCSKLQAISVLSFSSRSRFLIKIWGQACHRALQLSLNLDYSTEMTRGWISISSRRFSNEDAECMWKQVNQIELVYTHTKAHSSLESTVVALKKFCRGQVQRQQEATSLTSSGNFV